MTGPVTALLVGGGGAAGALARYAVDVAVGGRRATLVVNVLGSLAFGAASAGFGEGTAPALLVGTGFCGGFTTFSSLAVAVAEGAVDGDGTRRSTAAYAVGTLAAAVAAVLVGRFLVLAAVPG
ncbi:MAG: CrcB family protein [Haloferacaceae archaeon]